MAAGKRNVVWPLASIIHELAMMARRWQRLHSGTSRAIQQNKTQIEKVENEQNTTTIFALFSSLFSSPKLFEDESQKRSENKILNEKNLNHR